MYTLIRVLALVSGFMGNVNIPVLDSNEQLTTHVSKSQT
jgi:hypothetical protein